MWMSNNKMPFDSLTPSNQERSNYDQFTPSLIEHLISMDSNVNANDARLSLNTA